MEFPRTNLVGGACILLRGVVQVCSLKRREETAALGIYIMRYVRTTTRAGRELR